MPEGDRVEQPVRQRICDGSSPERELARYPAHHVSRETSLSQWQDPDVQTDVPVRMEQPAYFIRFLSNR